ncbi:hypothetical protein AAFF_G00417630 [Aldrovandia affinis]|uniref:Uncharacterized protein n=1 Tax=Aldrovandia affinis TaxID=143900 RepID=A0AAD7SAB6_9TELE|nr:hypothetical protein AAFF_G00417630 [Aldrovandia affinis]
MLGCIRGTLLLALLLESAETLKEARCTENSAPVHSPCLDRAHWHNLTRHLGEGIVTSHDESILVGPTAFDKIRSRPFHRCVLKNIFAFYNQALARQGGHYRDLRRFITRLGKCVVRVSWKRWCRKLYQDVRGMPVIETRGEKTLTAKMIAVLQIQKLQRAMEQLGDVKTQDKAIVELKMLEYYLPEGRARKDKAESRDKCDVKVQDKLSRHVMLPGRGRTLTSQQQKRMS